MPKYSKEHEKELIAKIQRVLIYDCNASIQAIQKILSTNGSRLDKDYINKLLKKIRGEKANRYKRESEKIAIAEIEDLVRYLNTELFKIMQMSSNDMVKISAIKQMVNQAINLFKIQRDSGVFKKVEIEEKNSSFLNIPAILSVIEMTG